MPRAGHALLCASLALAVAAATAGPRVSPASSRVPENLLRIELHLDAPLPVALDMRHVTLLDCDGNTLPAAFLDLPLPSRDGTTVSILLHPGRIKTGVGPNNALGPALHAGDEVTLLVDDPHLPAPVRKRWSVVAARRQKIDPGAWWISPPVAGSRSPLRVEPHTVLGSDARDLIAVADSQGRKVAGVARLSADESLWLFAPVAPWQRGNYTLRIHRDLEDVAGNRLCAAFEQANLQQAVCSNDGAVTFRPTAGPRAPKGRAASVAAAASAMSRAPR